MKQAPTEILPTLTTVAGVTVTRPGTCTACGAQRSGGDRFCETCGCDFESAESPWEAVVTAERDQFERLATRTVAFPDDIPPTTIPLNGADVRIGRGDPNGPGIDVAKLSGDPGVSRVHATLVRERGGSYAVVDRGSTNGTRINDESTPIEEGVLVPLADGDRIRIGAWTTITLQRAERNGTTGDSVHDGTERSV